MKKTTTKTATQAEFSHAKKAMRVAFDAGKITGDAGLPLVRQIDDSTGLTQRLAQALCDPRSGSITHSIEDLVRCRVYGIVQGYEDCNDFSHLRNDPMFKAACGRLGNDDELPSQPSLSRFENGATLEDIVSAREVLLEHFIERHKRLFKRPPRIILDLDTTDDPTHGQQELTFFHGYYDTYCYFLLQIYTAQGDLLWSELLPSKANVRVLATARVCHVVDRLRQVWPQLPIRLRADNGFACPALYEQCEHRDVIYEVNVGTHKVFQQRTQATALLAEAEQRFEKAKDTTTVRLFDEFLYKASTWDRERRIIVKAQYTKLGSDLRFLVTNSNKTPKKVYEDYAHRGQQENWIKDFKRSLKGDRLSCHRFLANYLRLLLFSVAYQLAHELRRHLPVELSSAQLDTIRLRLLRVPALVVETARNLWVRISSFYPWRDDWLATAAALGAASQ